MKLLFDQNISPRFVNRLADLYPGSSHVYPLGLGEAPDEDIWAHARREGFSVVTKDADFSDLCMMLGFPPNVVWLRRGNCTTDDIEVLLRRHHPDIQALGDDERTGVLTLL